jgi:hypothetical protein
VGRWKAAGNMSELFSKRVMEVLLTSVNGAWVKRTGEDKQEGESIRESNEIFIKIVGNR